MPIDTLKSILANNILLNWDSSNRVLKLIEKSKDSVIKELSILAIPDNMVAFTLDYSKLQQLSSYINKSAPHVNKGCDLVIFFEKNEHYKTIIFDLKSDSPNIQKTKSQLLNSKLFVKYLFSLLKEHFGKDFDSELLLRAGITSKCLTLKKTVYRARKSTAQNKRLENDMGFKPIPLKPRNGIAMVRFEQLV